MRNSNAVVRRIIAVVLTLIAIGSLFWPSMFTYSEDTRELTERQEDHLRDEYGASAKNLAKKILEETADQLERNGSVKGDAKKAAKDYVNILMNFLSGKFSLFALRSDASGLYRLATKYEVFYLARTALGSMGVPERYAEEMKEAFTALMIGMNVLFFTTLIFGVIAAVLYALNQTRAPGVIFTIMAFLCSLICLAVVIGCNIGFKDDLGFALFAPGASLFLLPLLALAGCIVYKREKAPHEVPDGFARTADFGQRNTYGEADRNAYNPQYRDTNRNAYNPQYRDTYQSAPEPQNTNTNRSAFGQQYREADRDACAQRPAEKPRFCTKCGAPVNGTDTFCTGCGQRLV